MARVASDNAPHGALRKTVRHRSPEHLSAVRSLCCLICGAYGCEAAHVRYASAEHGKPESGRGIKPGDQWTVPLCPAHHREQHGSGEREWWRRKGIDPLVVARRLWAATPDYSRMMNIILTEGDEIWKGIVPAWRSEGRTR